MTIIRKDENCFLQARCVFCRCQRETRASSQHDSLESNSSVVRLALIVLEDLVDAIAKGEKIVIEDERGQARAYNPFVAQGKSVRNNSRNAA